MKFIPFILAGGLAAYALISKSESGIVVRAISDRIKQVSVDGRAYIVFRLGEGEYNIMSITDPAVRITFGQDGKPFRHGDPVAVARLEEDMKRFPNNLFSGAI